MSNKIIEMIEGDWDDLVSRSDLRGHKVRVIVLDRASEAGTTNSQTPVDNAWLKNLNTWADDHQPIENTVDDSRDSIYSGSVDYPR